tara:strand:- start:235 stop:711 length:477 start_codon:yes stop_codon:yes gene_type:complete
MAKTPITWIELIKEHIKAKKGNSNTKVGVKDVINDAKKDWASIKNGSHDKYIQGSSKGKSRKSKKSKKSKTEKNTQDDEPSPGHKGAPSKTRPGHIDFRTHKGDKYYNRDGHRQTRNRKGKKGRPYTGSKTKKTRCCPNCAKLQVQIDELKKEVESLQ